MKCTLSLSLATVCNEILIFFHVYIESFNTRIRSSLHIGYTIRLMGEWGQQQVERSSFSTCWCVQEAAASRRRRHVHRSVGTLWHVHQHVDCSLQSLQELPEEVIGQLDTSSQMQTWRLRQQLREPLWLSCAQVHTQYTAHSYHYPGMMITWNCLWTWSWPVLHLAPVTSHNDTTAASVSQHVLTHVSCDRLMKQAGQMYEPACVLNTVPVYEPRPSVNCVELLPLSTVSKNTKCSSCTESDGVLQWYPPQSQLSNNSDSMGQLLWSSAGLNSSADEWWLITTVLLHLFTLKLNVKTMYCTVCSVCFTLLALADCSAQRLSAQK